METIAARAADLRQGRTTSVELVQRCLAAIERDNARTGAFISIHRDRALAEAAAADGERAAGGSRGPLHGIPVAIKDLIDEAGIVTTAGSTVLDDRIAPADAPVVQRLRDAGAIVIGRTNLHQFAVGTTSEDSAFGPVRHPRDETRVAGGSSGGSAAAVATGMCLASLGTDTGGSVRIPAAACGLVGLKPTKGEVPNEGVIPLSTTLDHVGPLAHTVQDAGWLCDVIAGRRCADVPLWPVSTLRLVRLTGYFQSAVDRAVLRVFEDGLARLGRAGIRIRSTELADAESIAPAYARIALPEAALWHAPYVDARADGYVPEIRARILQGRTTSAVEYLQALDTARQLRAHVDALLDDADLIVTPTLPILAPALGSTTIDVPGAGPMPVRGLMLRHTQLFNMTGHPAITLPIPTDGLPVGLQLIGRHGETGRMLSMAAACEAALGA